MNTCLNCAGLMGCRDLADAQGKFVPERVITENNFRECASWVPVGPLQNDVRQVLYGIQDVNSLRVLHQIPAMVMDQLIEQESVDGMSGDMPDFAGMIADGMTSAEREEQLRFETNPDGSFVEDEGVRRPRPSHQLRKFACDPEGHIQLDHSVGMFWTTDKVINHIVATEVELEYLTKTKKPRKGKASTKPKTAAKAATKPAAEAAPKTETKMAEGRRVMINRGGKAGSKAPGKTGGKLARPPAKKAASKAKAKAAEAEVEDDTSNGNGAAAPDFDMGAIVEEIKLAVGESVGGLIVEKFNEQEARIQALEDKLLDAVTIVYDLACQTAGTFSFETEEGETEALPEMFRNPDRVLGFVTGAETPPEE